MARPPVTQVKVFYYLRSNPSAQEADVLKALDISSSAFRTARSRMRSKGLKILKYCPICYRPSLVSQEGVKICRENLLESVKLEVRRGKIHSYGSVTRLFE